MIRQNFPFQYFLIVWQIGTGCLRDYSSLFPRQFLNEANLNVFPQNFSAIQYDIILQCNQLGSTLHYVG